MDVSDKNQAVHYECGRQGIKCGSNADPPPHVDMRAVQPHRARVDKRINIVHIEPVCELD